MLQQEQRQVITQRIDPKIILQNTILQLSSLELVQTIENEMLENPALEMLEDVSCSGDCIDPTACPFCTARRAREADTDYQAEALDTGDADLEYDTVVGTAFHDSDDDFDPVGNLEAEITLAEHLRGLLRAAVPAEDYWIGEYLINNLNDRGWLADKPETIAQELVVPVEDILRLLKVIQSFDPPGVGAQNLQECLLLQLCYLRDEDTTPENRRMNDLSERIVANYFDHMAAHRYTKLARLLGVSVDQVKQALKYIRTRLNPFPASQFRPPWAYRPSNSKDTVRPDVIIKRTEFGYDVEVLGTEAFALSINPIWREAYIQIKAGASHYSEEDKKQFTEYVERAELFIRNINQRRHSLRQITRCIVDYQTGFLETGSRQFLRPLTRTRIARILGIHESTVSRATANKYVQLPNQEVVSFNVFFNSSLSIKDAIGEIIHEEDPTNPLSDQQIVELLAERDIVVARRTIVKYRESQKILSSTRRRR